MARADGEGRRRLYLLRAIYVEMRSYVAGGETTIMFPSGVYFLFGDSSKVCVVGVLPGKNILNKLLEYSRQKAI